MVISSYQAIAAGFERQVADLKAAHEQALQILQGRVAELITERDFYRGEWLKSRDARFPSSADDSGNPPDSARPAIDQEVDASSSWSIDDLAFFTEWANARKLGEAEAKIEWRRCYGDASPVVALTV